MTNCGPVLSSKSKPNISFRIASFRHDLHIDIIPTYEKVESMSQVTLAELEGAVGNESEMARRDRLALLTENSEEGKGKGVGKQDNSRPKDPPKPKNAEGAKSDQPQAMVEAKAQVKPQCFKWVSDEGCSYGVNRQYTHEPVVKGRCYNCGATTRLKPACTRPGGGSYDPEMEQKGKGKGRGKSVAKARVAGAQSSTAGQLVLAELVV